MLPIPPEELRFWVGPFGDAELYRASGYSNLQSIIDLCGLKPHAQVLEVGCGCGRIATALASYLADSGGYDGFDVAAPLINWCREEMQPRLPRLTLRERRVLRSSSFHIRAAGSTW